MRKLPIKRAVGIVKRKSTFRGLEKLSNNLGQKATMKEFPTIN